MWLWYCVPLRFSTERNFLSIPCHISLRIDCITDRENRANEWTYYHARNRCIQLDEGILEWKLAKCRWIFWTFISLSGLWTRDCKCDEGKHIWSGYPSNNHGHPGGLDLHAVVPLLGSCVCYSVSTAGQCCLSQRHQHVWISGRLHRGLVLPFDGRGDQHEHFCRH